MNIDHLKYLVKLGDLKSINKVAAQMFRSRSSIISAMNKLEEDIGIGLFKRDIHGVTLTEHGQRVYREAQQILQIIDSWKNPEHPDLKQKILISALPSLAETAIPLLYAQLYDNFKNYIFEYEIIYNDIKSMINTVVGDNSDYKSIVIGGYFDFERDYYYKMVANSKCVSIPLFASDHSLLYNKNTDIAITDEVYLKNIVKQDVKFAVFKNAELSPIFYFFDKKGKAISVPSLAHVLNIINSSKNIMGVYPTFLMSCNKISHPDIRAAKCADYLNKLNFCIIYNENLTSDENFMKIIDYIRAFFNERF